MWLLNNLATALHSRRFQPAEKVVGWALRACLSPHAVVKQSFIERHPRSAGCSECAAPVC